MLPAWEAVTVQLPAPVMCTVLPETVQVPVAAKVTGCPESPPVALTVKSGSPKVLAPKGPKLIVWLAWATVRVAALLVALPALFVKTARYWLPLCETEGLVSGSGELVAPAMSFQVDPLFVLTCHFTVGAGLPLAAALNEALAP